MSDDTHLDDDVFAERPQTEDASDPFAALMDLSSEMQPEPEAVEPSFEPEAVEPSFEPEAVEPSFEPEAVEPSFEPEAVEPNFEPEPAEIAASEVYLEEPTPMSADDTLDDFLSAEFGVSEPTSVIDENVPSLDNSLEDDALLSALDADFNAPLPTDNFVNEPVLQEMPEALDAEFGLEDMALDTDDARSAAANPADATIAEEPFDLDDLKLDDIDLSQPPVAAAPVPPMDQGLEQSIDQAEDFEFDLGDLDISDDEGLEPLEAADSSDEFDIDDFLEEHEAETPIVEPSLEEAPSDPVSPAIAAATSLSASHEGWLGSDPINQEAEIGHLDEGVPEVSVEMAEAQDPFADLAIDLDLDLKDSSIDQPSLTDAGITNALRDAEVDDQIQSLEAHFAVPEDEAAVFAEEPVTGQAEEGTSSPSLGGLAAAGAGGLGLSKVFGNSAKAEPAIEAAAEIEPSAEVALDNVDDILGDIDNFEVSATESAPDFSPEIDIDDFKSDIDASFDLEPQIVEETAFESIEVPEVNIIDPSVDVPETGVISVPHVDYEVPIEPVSAGPDAFEQAISDSFAEMQDDDLLGEVDLRPSIDDELDLSLGDIDLQMDNAVSSEEAYRNVIADEIGAEATIADPEFDALIDKGLDFNDEELDGLRRQAGHDEAVGASALPLSEITGIAAAHESAKKSSNRKGLLIAACLAGVAIVVGSIGFGSSFFGNDSDDASATIIRSDTDGVKELPTEPSGIEVANKDSEVFQGSATTSEQDGQSALIDNREPLVGENSTKDLDRINPDDTVLSDASKALEDAAQSVMTPRRVQTLTVRPDGTIAPASEAPAASDNTVETPIAENDTERLLPATSNEAGADIAAVPQRTVNTVTVRNNETPRIAPTPSAPSANSLTTPDVVPIVPSRPANQPVNIVNNNTQVAAVRPQAPAVPAPAAPAAVPAGTYFVQIASTPSESDARATGNRLTSRFSSVFGGRGFVVRRAVIEGKGTFYRVRVPGGTRNEANALCSRYKSAGGSCFVSR